MSGDWLEFVELILSNELSFEKTSAFQKEMESIQYECIFVLSSDDRVA